MNYTPSQVSEMLGIPGSTLRHYARHFTKYLSPQQGRKQRLYTDKDILVFSQIKDLSALNIPLELIGPRLHVDDQQPAQLVESSLAYVPSIAAEIESAQAASRAALAQVEQLAAKVEQLSAEIAELKARDNRPWYKRILG